MADNDTPARRPGAFQPIEPIEETSGVAQAERAASRPPASVVVPALGEPPAPASEQARAAAPTVEIAARFGSAAAGLVFAGQVLSISQADGLAFGTDDERSYWVRARLELDIARELTAAAHGIAYVAVSSGRLIEDHGWGDPPAEGAGSGGSAATVDPATIAPASLAQLVFAAGLHPGPEVPAEEVRVLVPGWLMPDLVRRALDQHVDTAHRPVRLHPLFGPATGSHGATGLAASTAQIELRLSARQGRHLPSSMLVALARQPQLCVCRTTGDNDNLLVEYGMTTPLFDHLLAGLIGDQTWLLSAGQLGGRVIEPAGSFIDSATCVRLIDFPLESQDCPSDDRPAVPGLQLVSERTHGRNVDAILLSSADLDSVALLLEGQPLSESAQLVRGRDRHLLLAPGGLLERLPIGESLYCLGPGPLYLPLGTTTRPKLPAAARRVLFKADQKFAMVLLATQILKFSLEYREPVWTLWAGPLPELDLQLPPQALETLDGLDRATSETKQSSEPEAGTVSAEGVRTWLDDALEYEFRGELALAAELHERHGDPMRAAHLYYRAAEEVGNTRQSAGHGNEG